MCKRCKPNLDNHTPARLPNRKPPAKQQHLTDQYDTSLHRNQSNCSSDPALQVSVTTPKPNYISELLEATRKITRYFKMSYKNSKLHRIETENKTPHKFQSNLHNPDKHVHKTHSNADQVNELIGLTHSLKVQNLKLNTQWVMTTPIPTILIVGLVPHLTLND